MRWRFLAGVESETEAWDFLIPNPIAIGSNIRSGEAFLSTLKTTNREKSEIIPVTLHKNSFIDSARQKDNFLLD